MQTEWVITFFRNRNYKSQRQLSHLHCHSTKLVSGVSGIADFVISKFIFANSIIIFWITSFQNISDIFRETVIPPLNCDILLQSEICWIIKKHVRSSRLHTYSPHNLLKKYEVLGCLLHWQQC